MPNTAGPQVAGFSPQQGRRIMEAVKWFEAHGRNGITYNDNGPSIYHDYWIEITGNAVVSGTVVYTWKHKYRRSSNTFADHLDGVVSSSSSPDTRAYYPGVGVLKTGAIVRAIVDMDENGVITYTIEAPATTVMFPARITSVSGSFPTWSYTVQRIVSFNSTLTGAAKWVTDSTNITGVLNRCEFAGTATYTYGTGLSITNASTGVVNSTTCVYKSIGVGNVVDVTGLPNNSGTITYSFSQTNSAQ